MSGLKAFESIRGTISGESTLSGTLSVATGQDYDIYSGEYEIIPDVEDEQTLETAHKLLTDNIVVAKVLTLRPAMIRTEIPLILERKCSLCQKQKQSIKLYMVEESLLT